MPETTSLNKYGLKEATIRLCIKEGTTLYGSQPINTPEDGAAVMYDLLSTVDREMLCVVNVDARNRPVNYNIVSIGDLDKSIVSIRNIFAASILSNAHGFILLHNHPSGDPSPSTEDVNVTARVLEASKLMGIRLLDHVIIGNDKNFTYSFRTANPDMFADMDYNPEVLWGEEVAERSENVSESDTFSGPEEDSSPDPETPAEDNKNVSDSDTFSSLSFSEQVDFVLKLDRRNAGRYSALKVCETPALLRALGLPALPMHYEQKHLHNAIRPKAKTAVGPHFHGLAVEQIKRMPEWLASPLIVYDSLSRDDAIVVLTEEVDADGLPIICAIRPNGTAVEHGKDVLSNFVLSCYGHKNLGRQLAIAVEEDRILYVNNKISQDQLGVPMLTLPRGLRDPDFTGIIHQSRNISSGISVSSGPSTTENVSESDTIPVVEGDCRDASSVLMLTLPQCLEGPDTDIIQRNAKKATGDAGNISSADFVSESDTMTYGEKGTSMDIMLNNLNQPLSPGQELAAAFARLELYGYGNPTLNADGGITVDYLGSRLSDVTCASPIPYAEALRKIMTDENMTSETLSFFLTIDKKVVDDVLEGKTWLSHRELVQVANILGYSARELEAGNVVKGTDYEHMMNRRYMAESHPAEHISGYVAENPASSVYLIYDRQAGEYVYDNSGDLVIHTDYSAATMQVSDMNESYERSRRADALETGSIPAHKNVSESDTSETVDEENEKKIVSESDTIQTGYPRM